MAAPSILPQCVPCRTERCMVVGYIPRELSCKCSLSSIALRVPGASAQSVVVSR